jgi:hypothetical protein
MTGVLCTVCGTLVLIMLYTCKLSWLLGVKDLQSDTLIYYQAVNRHCPLVLLAVKSTIQYLHMKLIYHFNLCTQHVHVFYTCTTYSQIYNNICVLITLLLSLDV